MFIKNITKKASDMNKKGLTTFGYILSFIGCINVEKRKMRLLHPLVWVLLPFITIIAVIVCIFSDGCIQDYFVDNYTLW